MLTSAFASSHHPSRHRIRMSSCPNEYPGWGSSSSLKNLCITEGDASSGEDLGQQIRLPKMDINFMGA
jgi:hypothetical protein